VEKDSQGGLGPVVRNIMKEKYRMAQQQWGAAVIFF